MKPLVWIFCLVCLAVAGCSGKGYTGDARYALEGEVTVNDEPLDGAMIAFLPNSGGRPAGGPILGGKYSVPAGQGANQGSYRVEIRWLKPTGKQRKDDDTGGMVDIVKEALPPRYNDKTELKAEVGSGENRFDFALIVAP